MHRLGETRSRRAADHLLQTPDTFVWAPLPGMKNATACVHVAPALGAAFTQYTAVMEDGGELASTGDSRFIYVLEGTLQLSRHDSLEELGIGGFAYIPSMTPHIIRAFRGAARITVIEKHYVDTYPERKPHAVVGNENEVPATALLGDEALQVRTLLPADVAYDFAVNTMEYQPGASLSMVEVHVMEHGLLMLEGEGIYRLGDAWYPVAKGDFIWMGPYCPQWFGALGKTPARYLIYKDWNRHPLQVTR
jgi:(S)-ureidoglycine aminohydrolase